MRFCITINSLVILTLAFSALSCNSSSSSDPAPSNPFAPVVNAVTPKPAKTGETLTVTGANLNAPDAVRIGKTVVTPINITATSFKIVVPSNAVTGKLYVFNSFGADSSKTITLSAGIVLKPSVTTVSPSTAAIGGVVTVSGTNLGSPDSIKLGNERITTTQNDGTSFKFTVSSNAFSGKLFVFNRGGVDSSKSITITEPTGRPTASTLTCLIDGKPFSGTVLTLPQLHDTVVNLYISGTSGWTTIKLEIPDQYEPITYPASDLHYLSYTPSTITSLDDKFLANGKLGSSGSIKVLTPNTENYIRGTFNFVGVFTTNRNRKVKVTNGRFAIRFQ